MVSVTHPSSSSPCSREPSPEGFLQRVQAPGQLFHPSHSSSPGCSKANLATSHLVTLCPWPVPTGASKQQPLGRDAGARLLAGLGVLEGRQP